MHMDGQGGDRQTCAVARYTDTDMDMEKRDRPGTGAHYQALGGNGNANRFDGIKEKDNKKGITGSKWGRELVRRGLWLEQDWEAWEERRQ